MKKGQAAAILEALGAGCNPSTGEVLAPESALQDPRVLKALFVAVSYLRMPQEDSEGNEIDVEVKVQLGGDLSVHEIATELFGGTFNGGPARFKKGGWIDVGTAHARCPDCSSKLHGLRKPYESSGRVFHYWALLCQRCKTAIPPSDLEEQDRLALYKTSELRPGPAGVGAKSSA